MKSARFSIAVIATIVCALVALVPWEGLRVHAEDSRQRDLAIHWSPFIYQASHNNYDIPTNWDFDGNWLGEDNWEQAFSYINQFQTYVYYTFQETDTHIFIVYLFFHPRDTKMIGPHENDWEGARVSVTKDGSAYGQLYRLETFHHGNLSETTAPEIINGSHPAVWVEARAHGVYVSNTVGFPSDCGGMGIWYAGRGAEIPEHCDDRDVSMDLISFEDTLWPRRFGSPYAGTQVYANGAYFGKLFKDDDGCHAKPPWSWEFSSDGFWFMGPAQWFSLSTNYLYNPYSSDMTSVTVSACP